MSSLRILLTSTLGNSAAFAKNVPFVLFSFLLAKRRILNVETSNIFEKSYVKMNYYGPGTGNKDL